MIVVIDTNVPIVANGDSEQASPACVLVCVECIRQIRTQGRLVLDDRWRIVREYMKNLQSSGQPGVGDAFLKWVLTNQANPNRCELVTITPVDPADPNETDFREFPADPDLAGFDPADRKFVAVACAHPDHPSILQAADFKWWNFQDTLLAHGVEVRFVCEDDLQRWINEQKQD
ncbi:MAG: hypothetical protein JXQ72_15310 [Anaerolineae bacterium]|nr:hypothetical protein [Anaerolineae bacterium]